jgi:hypothetical protein
MAPLNSAAGSGGDSEMHQLSASAKKWHVAASEKACGSLNPIRRVVEAIKPSNCGKAPISLSLGELCCWH